MSRLSQNGSILDQIGQEEKTGKHSRCLLLHVGAIPRQPAEGMDYTAPFTYSRQRYLTMTIGILCRPLKGPVLRKYLQVTVGGGTYCTADKHHVMKRTSPWYWVNRKTTSHREKWGNRLSYTCAMSICSSHGLPQLMQTTKGGQPCSPP